MINLGNIEIADLRLGASQVKAVYLGNEQVWVGEQPIPIGDALCFTAEQNGSTLRLDKVGSPGAISLQTSDNEGATWKDYNWSGNTGDEFGNLNVGDKVYFRAKIENSTIGSSSSNYYKFVMSGKIAASGNVQTLLKADSTRTDAPAYCYNGMFNSCTSLTTAPALPATTLASQCYNSMFQGCTSLTTAPELPATTLASNCYNAMFSGCTSLASAPELSTTTLAKYCYNGMFQGCTSLTTAPELPATTLASNCYGSMFNSCTSLMTAPALPATTLANRCYSNMFNGCSSLTKAPALPATTLATYCYDSMFHSCSNLTSIDVNFTAWNPTNATQNWLYGVAASGTFTCPAALSDTRGTSNIPVGWTKKEPIDIPLTFTATQANSWVKLNKVGSPDEISLEYSKNGSDWYTYSWLIDGTGYSIALTNVGSKAMFRARSENSTISKTLNDYYQFIITGQVAASGNIQSLLKADGTRTNAPSYCYAGMFNGCSSLTKAPMLPATTLGDYCYYSMFADCTSLTSAPTLPATTLASYCYSDMFWSCTSLTTAPALPATTLGSYCYYSMFADCSSLTSAPTLPAKTLASNCYSGMFQDCTSLSSVEVAFTEWPSNGATTNWLDNVAASGTFTCPATLPDTRDDSHIPTDWTKADLT